MRLKKWKQMMVSVMTATLLLGMAFPQQSKAEEPTNSPVVKVAGGAFHKLALKEDGTVVAWGHHFLNDTPMPEMKHVKLMDAEGYYSVFVYEDGRVVTWGDGEYSVPKNPPAKLDNVVAVSAGFRHVLALKED
ncbi:MAG TPA: hypothetical protein VNM45_17650, partial [Bacillus sp. (in: firmicutes)]|nr:hypothetical protein [Bacillus sp. (in: firmicutes)]